MNDKSGYNLVKNICESAKPYIFQRKFSYIKSFDNVQNCVKNWITFENRWAITDLVAQHTLHISNVSIL